MKFGLALSLFAFTLLMNACTYDNEQELFGDDECGDLSAVSLKNDIVPILENQCYACHGAGIETAGVNLETYDRLVQIAESGRLLGALRHETEYANMPPSGQMLPECDIRKIRKWIDQGTQNN